VWCVMRFGKLHAAALAAPQWSDPVSQCSHGSASSSVIMLGWQSPWVLRMYSAEGEFERRRVSKG
jgi:hypothetical protein